jgi:Flp pilus assembly pilin Flp
MLEMILAYARSYAAMVTKREEGQALVEYALILGLVSVVAITILQTLGTNVVGRLTDVANALVPGGGA